MIRNTFRNMVAGVLGLMAAAGLPLATDEQSARRVAGVVKKNGTGGTPAQRRRGGRRREYLPNARRASCRFVYARPGKQAAAKAYLAVITNNDRMANAMTARRLAQRGLPATG